MLEEKRNGTVLKQFQLIGMTKNRGNPLGAFFNDRDFRHLSEKYSQAYENIATHRSSSLIFFVYQWRHSIIFLESFAVIACPAKTILIGYVSDAAV